MNGLAGGSLEAHPISPLPPHDDELSSQLVPDLFLAPCPLLHVYPVKRVQRRESEAFGRQCSYRAEGRDVVSCGQAAAAFPKGTGLLR